MKDAKEFYIDDHAALYGFLARSADAVCAEEGLKAVERATVSYGRERGLRCAMRCRRDGGELTMENYLLYGEWLDERRWSKSEIVGTDPEYRTQTLVCGWNETWKKYGLGEYGKIYCRWIDKELLYGFNPALKLEMSKILSFGDDACDFHWLDCRFDEAGLEKLHARRAELAPRVTKDFLFHCAHLLSAFRRELYRELGLIEGDKILEKALKEYENAFGKEKAEAIAVQSKQNFIGIE